LKLHIGNDMKLSIASKKGTSDSFAHWTYLLECIFKLREPVISLILYISRPMQMNEENQSSNRNAHRSRKLAQL
jgi:hypothetical protein